LFAGAASGELRSRKIAAKLTLGLEKIKRKKAVLA
jgi:hypothetical protein